MQKGCIIIANIRVTWPEIIRDRPSNPSLDCNNPQLVSAGPASSSSDIFCSSRWINWMQCGKDYIDIVKSIRAKPPPDDDGQPLFHLHPSVLLLLGPSANTNLRMSDMHGQQPSRTLPAVLMNDRTGQPNSSSTFLIFAARVPLDQCKFRRFAATKSGPSNETWEYNFLQFVSSDDEWRLRYSMHLHSFLYSFCPDYVLQSCSTSTQVHIVECSSATGLSSWSLAWDSLYLTPSPSFDPSDDY